MKPKPGRPKTKPSGATKKHAGRKQEAGAKGPPSSSSVDPASVFVRGLPQGTTDKDLRVFLEARVGAVLTCFVIRDDYGIAKFHKEEDARRCLQELNGSEFQGSTLQIQAGKPKRGAAAKGKQLSVASEGDKEPNTSVHLRSIHLSGLPRETGKVALQEWIEEKLPGGCGIESVRRILGKSGEFAVSFRKDQNARRALECLSGAEMNGQTVTASLRALELSRQSSKAGRLIIRNLSFDAREKHLRKVFEKIGELADVHIPTKEGKKGATRGFGFVQYAEASSAERAVADLNGTKICGRAVAVDWAVDASVFTKLQSEEQPEPASAQAAKPKERKAKKEKEKPAPAKESDAEEEDPDPNSELKRMKELLGDEIEEDDEEEDEADAESEDEEDETKGKKKLKAKAKDTKENRKPGFDVEQGQSVFVRNVPFDAGEADLKEVFRRFGKVRSVKMVADKTGQNAHRGSAFVKFVEAAGADAALATEEEADRKLKELSSVVRRSDQRELPAVEGFGISLKGRRLVVKPAVKPQEASELSDKSKTQKGQASKERRTWMHLLNVGDIPETSPKWENLSKSEQRQRREGQKERKWRINNSNFALHPQRLSIRNLPTFVDANKLREAVVKHLADTGSGADRKERVTSAQQSIVKALLVRDGERRMESGERRSKGYGFMAFKDHDTAMKTLEFLNDNPKVFGGGRRPIVEFAVEDKRKLRMQEEQRQRFEEKLKKKGQTPAAAEGGAEAAAGAEGAAAKAKAKKRKKRPAEGEGKQKLGRGARQRERRRAAKAAAAERGEAKAKHREMRDKRKAMAIEERKASKARKERPSSIPDARESKRPRKGGELEDDFELRALERFRRGGKT